MLSYSLLYSSPAPKHTKHYCLSSGLKWIHPEQGQVLIMIIPMSLEQGRFGLCLIKAALQYFDICYICTLWVKGSAQASLLRSVQPLLSLFFPPLLFITKPLLSYKKSLRRLSPIRERNMIRSLISSILRFAEESLQRNLLKTLKKFNELHCANYNGNGCKLHL